MRSLQAGYFGLFISQYYGLTHGILAMNFGNSNVQAGFCDDNESAINLALWGMLRAPVGDAWSQASYRVEEPPWKGCLEAPYTPILGALCFIPGIEGGRPISVNQLQEYRLIGSITWPPRGTWFSPRGL
jgi:hypothetical protein